VAGLILFCAIPFFSWRRQDSTVWLVWSVVIPAVPALVLGVGFHRWRNICPLATIARLPTWLGHPGKQRMPAAVEANYPYIAFAALAAALWLRLIVLNGNGHATSAFFVMLSLAAFSAGAVFSGKTWCNYLCPVSLVERIYSDPGRSRAGQNSQCAPCTACKRHCPDINQDASYWKEIRLRPRRFTFFAFPGMALGFFLDSRRELPAPHALGAAATLMTGAATSLALFWYLERRLVRRALRHGPGSSATQARHAALSSAAFAAFVVFFGFAGLHVLPGDYRWDLMWVGVITVAGGAGWAGRVKHAPPASRPVAAWMAGNSVDRAAAQMIQVLPVLSAETLHRRQRSLPRRTGTG
jgi:polyferredoxin